MNPVYRVIAVFVLAPLLVPIALHFALTLLR